MLRIDSFWLRSLLLTVSVAGIAIFLLPLTVHIVNAGNLFGLAVSLLLLTFTLWNAPISAWLSRAWEHRAGKIILSAVFSLLILGVLLCLVLSVMMVCASRKKPQSAPQAVVVLGCKVRGTEPSLMLYRRVHAAYDALQADPTIVAVVSGGQGIGEDISEARCMADELIKLGIAQERILLEDQSVSTSENLLFSRKILMEHELTGDILLATDGYHQCRAQYLAKREGLNVTGAVVPYTSWYLLPTYWVREWFGLLHAYVFGT